MLAVVRVSASAGFTGLIVSCPRLVAWEEEMMSKRSWRVGKRRSIRTDCYYVDEVVDPHKGKLRLISSDELTKEDAELIASAPSLRAENKRLREECERLSGVLQAIDGGDCPVTDEALLRQWAYEAITLGKGVDDLSPRAALEPKP